MASEWQYMPILKWKRGERDALRYLPDKEWEQLVPLLELDPIGAAPDAVALKAALPAYVTEIAKQIIRSIPEAQSVAIDTSYVSSGFPRKLNLLMAIYSRLQKLVPHNLIPVIRANSLDALTGLTESYTQVLKNASEVVLRLRIDQLGAAQVAPSVNELAKFVKRKQIHLLLDQFSIVDKKHNDCFAALSPYLTAASGISCASVTVAGGSFPINLTGKKQGVTDLPRVEWAVWVLMAQKDDYEDYRYADYAVSNPTPMEEDIDPTKVNPSVAIRYTSDQFWRLYKGRGFKKGGPGQLKGLSKLLVTDVGIYAGQGFSYGDGQYMKYSAGSEKNGIPWTWRRDATNHHIMKTISQL